MVAFQPPRAARPLEFARRHEAAQYALVGEAPTPGKLEVDALLAVLEESGRHVDGAGAGVFVDIDHFHLRVVDEDGELIVFAGESLRGEPLGERERRWARGLVGRPTIAGAMLHQPIDQLARLGTLR